MVVAAAAAAISLCRPAPALGTLTYHRRGAVHVLNLATCRDRIFGKAQPTGRREFIAPNGIFRASVHHDTIVVTNLRNHRSFGLYRGPHAVELLDWSPDSRWILFAVDPMGSASIAADGLRLRAVPVDAGGAVTIAPVLLYDDYRAWCGGSLVLTAGGDRIATTNKRLIATRPGPWRTRRLEASPRRAWGSLVCTPGGKAVIVQGQRATGRDMSTDRSHWALWRVGLEGSSRRLTSPPRGYSDDSPRFAGNTLFFVRSHRGKGEVYALRGGTLFGPFASLGTEAGYYGHRAWEYSVSP